MKLILAACLALTLLAGCGSSSGNSNSPAAPVPTPSQGHVVALANTVCREYYERVTRALRTALGPAEERQLLAQEQRTRARVRAIMTTAASRPQVRTLLSDLTAREKWITTAESPGDDERVDERLYRARVKVYDDEKAIGLTSCLGSHRPRKPIE